MKGLTQCIRKIFSSKGYCIGQVNCNEVSMQVDLVRDGRFSLWCPSCQRSCGCNRVMHQSAYDLPFGPIQHVLLGYEAVQGWCVHCQRHFTVRPEGIEADGHSTTRLKLWVSRLCRHLPLNAVAELVPVSVSTVCRWDKEILKRYLPEPDFDNLKVLLVDEKNLGRRHGFVTLVLEAEKGELLYARQGRKEASLNGFFQQLTQTQRERIEAVVMDRSAAYRKSVGRYLPHARIVYDKFHVIANYHEAIDDIRRQEYNQAKKEDRKVIKGQRYNLFRNPENLTDNQNSELKELLDLNENLNIAYILKDDLKQLWTYRYPGYCAKFLERWVEQAKEASIPSLTRFANGLLKAKQEIINFCKYPFTNARMEAFNNVISRILHRTCGIKDLDYLFLKLRQETVSSLPP